jgi:hypothetical protein
MKEVSITFWENTDENNILSFSSPSIPTYHKGDIIFLSVSDHAKPFGHELNVKELNLTRFVIEDVHHSVRQEFIHNNERNEDNPFPFKIITLYSMDVYVKRIS